MADNVSPETGSETADLSIDQIAAKRAAAASQEEEAAQIEQPSDEQEAPEDEAVETPEEETAETEEDEVPEEATEPEIKDDVLIKLDDGSTITVSELKSKASTLEAENARISQESANERSELQKMGKDLSSTYEKVIQYLASKLPPEPDEALIWSDPTRHHQMTYLRNSAINELQALLGAQQETEGLTQQLSESDFKAYEAAETEKLIKAVPNLKDPARFKSAMQKVNAYAKSIGYDDDTIAKTKDARVLQMAIDAAYGREAREAAQKAKAQVKTSVAKQTPQTRTVHANSTAALQQVNAMKRAAKTGSIDDVLAARLARAQ